MSLRTPRPLLLGIALGLAACGGASPAGPHDARVIPASPSVSTTDSVASAPASTASTSSVTSTTSTAAATAPTTALSSAAAASPPAAAPHSTSAPLPAAPTAAASPVPAAGAWTLTVYYTAVESFHSGPPQAVTGCRPGADECSNGTDALGSYPGDFLDAVRSQGSGRITSGKYAGKYLMWDADSGYAVDTAVLDQSDRPLRPFVSAGAGNPGIAPGTAFGLLDCGVDTATGAAPDAGACARLRSASWMVTGPTRQPAGPHVLELYVGEEDGPGFATSPLIVHAQKARTTLP